MVFKLIKDLKSLIIVYFLLGFEIGLGFGTGLGFGSGFGFGNGFGFGSGFGFGAGFILIFDAKPS